MKQINLFYWGCVGLQGFQLLGFLTERNPKLIATTIPILTISLTLIALSAYLDYSKCKNNASESKILFLLAPHVSITVLVVLVFYLGGYLGNG